MCNCAVTQIILHFLDLDNNGIRAIKLPFNHFGQSIHWFCFSSHETALCSASSAFLKLALISSCICLRMQWGISCLPQSLTRWPILPSPTFESNKSLQICAAQICGKIHLIQCPFFLPSRFTPSPRIRWWILRREISFHICVGWLCICDCPNVMASLREPLHRSQTKHVNAGARPQCHNNCHWTLLGKTLKLITESLKHNNFVGNLKNM